MQNVFKRAQELANKLTPKQKRDLMKLYILEKNKDSNLDKSVDELTKEIKDGFNHDVTPK